MTSPRNLPGTEPIPSNTHSLKASFSAPTKRQVSLGGYGYIGFRPTALNGESLSPSLVTLTLLKDGEELPVEVEGVKESEGEYTFLLGPEFTREKNELEARWDYTVNGETFRFTEYITIREQMPTYDGLTDSEKFIIEQVTWLFGDLFDSTEGGVFLSETFQSHFNYERIAQLSLRALQRINLTKQPITNYYIGSGSGSRLPEKYSGVLVTATYLEVLKHLIRSYVEIPEFRGMNTTYTDRRDYMNRWKSVLDMEKDDLNEAITLMKREHLGLGRGALVVAGGIYGGSGKSGFFQAGTYASQLRGSRFMPAVPTPIVMRG